MRRDEDILAVCIKKVWAKEAVPYRTHKTSVLGKGQHFYSICGFTCRAGVHLPPYCLIISVCDGGSKPLPYDLFGYDAFAIGISAAFSIFSMKIPYPVVGSLMRTWVTAPTSLPF